MSTAFTIDQIRDRIRSLGLDRDVLKTFTIIEGVFINESPLHVGKGRGELGEVDLPVLRDWRNVPYIPGSSLKGVVRAFCEAIAKGSGLKACSPFTSDGEICAFSAELLNFVLQRSLQCASIDELRRDLAKEREKVVSIAKRRISNEAQRDRIVSEIENLLNSEEGLLSLVKTYSPCVVCRLFGNQALASRVIIFDAYPENPSMIRTDMRTRVAIDRFREAARSAALFRYEFVPPGFRWRFRMEIRNLDLTNCDSDECRLMNVFLKHFAELGLSLGGLKSVGHGLLKLDPEYTVIHVYRVEDLTLRLDKSVKLSELLRSGG